MPNKGSSHFESALSCVKRLPYFSFYFFFLVLIARYDPLILIM